MRLGDWVVALYRKLGRAFPDEFRADCGDAIDGAAEDMVHDAVHRGGTWRLLAVAPRLLLDLAGRIAAEHLAEIAQDTRYAARILARSPWFTLAAVICLAIGIGGSAGMYAQLRSTVFQPTPGIADPDSLIRLRRTVSYPMYENLQDAGEPFATVAAYHGPAPILVSKDGATAERIWCHIVSPGYFDVVGVSALRGRLFGKEERAPGSAPTLVLSERVWQSRFGADPRIVGSTIRVNGRPAMVIGIAANAFKGLSPTTAVADAWIATTADPAIAPEFQWLHNRGTQTFYVVGRLQPKFDEAAAEALLEARVRQLEQTYNDPDKDRKEQRVTLVPAGRLYPVRDQDLPRVVGFPFVLVTLVLLMACGNVSNMLLARGAERRPELALRVSLGANRGRIVRQLLTENAILAALGWGGGVLYAFGILRLFESVRTVLPTYVYYEPTFDWHSLLVAAGVATLCGILFGISPALRAAGKEPFAGLKRGGQTPIRRYRLLGLRNVLVFQQVAFSMVLLLLTGFIVIGWQRAAAIDTGFQPNNLFLVHLDPLRDGYTQEETAAFFARLPRELRQIPGVAQASVAQELPAAMSGGDGIVTAKTDFTDGVSGPRAIRQYRVGSGFFKTAGIRVEAGRPFRPGDERDDATVLLVNTTLAKSMGGPHAAMGKTLHLRDRNWEVIGVVADTRSALPLTSEQPEAYLPNLPEAFARPTMSGVVVALRATLGPEASTLLRREMERLDPRLTVIDVRRMTDEMQQTHYLAQFSAIVYGGMGAFGLILAAVGLAGITAYSVARRRHEIGIRLALGAESRQILWLVMRESGGIVIAGTVVGVGLSLLVMRALSAALEALAEATKTSMSDPLVIVGGPLLLASIALLACYFPARRSTRINPVTALRTD